MTPKTPRLDQNLKTLGTVRHDPCLLSKVHRQRLETTWYQFFNIICLRERSFILVPPGPGRIWGATKFFRPVWGATKFFRPIWGATRFFKRVWGAAKFFRLVWGATKFFRPTWSLEGNFLDLIGGLRKFSDRFWGLRNFLDQFGGLRNFLDPLGGLRNFSDLFGGLRNELKVRPSPPGTSINDRSLKYKKILKIHVSRYLGMVLINSNSNY